MLVHSTLLAFSINSDYYRKDWMLSYKILNTQEFVNALVMFIIISKI